MRSLKNLVSIHAARFYWGQIIKRHLVVVALCGVVTCSVLQVEAQTGAFPIGVWIRDAESSAWDCTVSNPAPGKPAGTISAVYRSRKGELCTGTWTLKSTINGTSFKFRESFANSCSSNRDVTIEPVAPLAPGSNKWRALWTDSTGVWRTLTFTCGWSCPIVGSTCSSSFVNGSFNDCVCNAGRYGPFCNPCPGLGSSSSGQPCNGRGVCEGDGTMNGTGKCTCTAGFYGSSCDRECGKFNGEYCGGVSRGSCTTVGCVCNPGSYGTSCESPCPEGQFMLGDGCTSTCPILYDGLRCVSSCSSNQFRDGLHCRLPASAYCSGATGSGKQCYPGSHLPGYGVDATTWSLDTNSIKSPLFRPLYRYEAPNVMGDYEHPHNVLIVPNPAQVTSTEAFIVKTTAEFAERRAAQFGIGVANLRRSLFASSGEFTAFTQDLRQGRFWAQSMITKRLSTMVLRSDAELDPFFEASMRALTPTSSAQELRSFLSRYGTHYIGDLETGGRWMLSVSASSCYLSSAKEDTLSEGLQAEFNMVSLGLSNVRSSTALTSLYKSYTRSSLGCFGGDSSLCNGGVASWLASVNTQPIPVRVNLVPVSDLFADPTMKSLVKVAIDTYLDAAARPSVGLAPVQCQCLSCASLGWKCGAPPVNSDVSCPSETDCGRCENDRFGNKFECKGHVCKKTCFPAAARIMIPSEAAVGKLDEGGLSTAALQDMMPGDKVVAVSRSTATGRRGDGPDDEVVYVPHDPKAAEQALLYPYIGLEYQYSDSTGKSVQTNTLYLSEDHIVFLAASKVDATTGATLPSEQLIFDPEVVARPQKARLVSVGDHLWHVQARSDSYVVVPVRVIKKVNVSLRGSQTVVTRSGTVVVEGILCSSFAGSHNIGHGSYHIHRWLYTHAPSVLQSATFRWLHERVDKLASILYEYVV